MASSYSPARRLLAAALLCSCGAQAEAPAVSRSLPEHSASIESERRQAEVWDLTDLEWSRYQSLIRGIRGAVSVPGISPIEVLGIHARDPAEQRHYAERWARLMHEDAERVLAFEQAYRAAFQRLFPTGRPVDLAMLDAIGEAHPSVEDVFEVGDRLLVFLDIRCEQSCRTLIAGLLRRARLSPGLGLDLYFVGRPGDLEIQTWARAQGITSDRVREGRVTLNHDGGLLATLHPTLAQIPNFPIVMHRRGTAVARIADPERLAL